MPMVEIPGPLFGRLQRLAVPLVDTPVTVVERLIDYYEVGQRPAATTRSSAAQEISSKNNGDNGEVREFDPDAPPDLRHTRVLIARFGNRSATGWNNLVHVAHVETLLRLGSIDGLRRTTKSNFVVGRETKKGYHYVPEIDLSIQNVDAEHAWSNCLRLARQLDIALIVEFEWMQNGDAAYPGKRGRLSWK